jgi:hypothetical protein
VVADGFDAVVGGRESLLELRFLFQIEIRYVSKGALERVCGIPWLYGREVRISRPCLECFVPSYLWHPTSPKRLKSWGLGF